MEESMKAIVFEGVVTLLVAYLLVVGVILLLGGTVQ